MNLIKNKSQMFYKIFKDFDFVDLLHWIAIIFYK